MRQTPLLGFSLLAVALAACGGASQASGPDAAPAQVPDAPAPAPDAPAPAPDAPPSSGGDITFTSQHLGELKGNTDLVAYQDGDGPWQLVSGTNGVYAFHVNSQRYGIAAACERPDDGSTFVTLGFFALTDERARFGLDICTSGTDDTFMPVAISGVVLHVPDDTQAWITTGLNRIQADPQAPFTMPAVPGPGTLIGTLLNESGVKGLVKQEVTFGAGAQFHLDFGAAFAPATAGVTLDPGAASILMETEYIDPTLRHHHIGAAQTPTTTYQAMPLDHLGTGLTTLEQISDDVAGSRTVTKAFRDPVAQTLVLPPLFQPSPPRIVTTAPYPIVEIGLPRTAGATHYLLNYQTSDQISTHHWDVTISAAWDDGAGASLVSRLPDLSALPGWKASYALESGAVGTWDAIVGTGSALFIPGSLPFGHLGEISTVFHDGDVITTSLAGGLLPGPD